MCNNWQDHMIPQQSRDLISTSSFAEVRRQVNLDGHKECEQEGHHCSHAFSCPE